MAKGSPRSTASSKLGGRIHFETTLQLAGVTLDLSGEGWPISRG